MNALKIVKTVLQVVSIGTSFALTIIAGKELDAKVAEKVAKALENK